MITNGKAGMLLKTVDCIEI